MKNIYKSFALLCMGLAATACIEENFENNGPKYDTTPGNEIVFSATAGIENGMPEPETRTVYGDQGTANGKNWIEINWVDNKDMVQIVSPEAAGPEVGHYLVTGASQQSGFNQTHRSASLTKLGDGALQWSESEDYTFYGVYPSFAYDTDTKHGATASLSKEGVFTGSMPIDQNYILNEDGSAANGWIAAPDMRYAFMTAMDTYKREPAEGYDDETSAAERAINLEFKSMVTALQFDIKPGEINYKDPVTNEIVTEMEVISVSLLSNKVEPGQTGKSISGSFSYNIPEDSYSATKGTRMVSLHFDNKSVKLSSLGKSLNVTFFILPEDFDSTDKLQLQIIFKLGATQVSRIATINTSNEGKPILGGKKYIFNDVQLPALKTGVVSSSWWDTLDPNTILPQISIPVAANVFANPSYGVSETEFQQQTEKIGTLWSMGVRGFEICCQTAAQGGSEAMLNDGTELYYSSNAANYTTAASRSLKNCRVVAAQSFVGTSEDMTFHNAFDLLCRLLKQSEGAKNECLFVICTYMAKNDGYCPYTYVSNLVNYLEWYCSNNDLGITEDSFKMISDDTTVGDLRGKIAIIVRPGDNERWAYQNDALTNPATILGLTDAQVPTSNLTGLMSSKLAANSTTYDKWKDNIMLIEDWGNEGYDVWDRRYGSNYARQAVNIELLPSSRRPADQTTAKSYFEDYLWAATEGTTTVGSTSYTSSTALRDFPTDIPVFNKLSYNYNYEHNMSNGNKAYVQEWMRVIPDAGIGPIAVFNEGANLWITDTRRTMWVKWPGSYAEKQHAIENLFEKAAKTRNQKFSNIYINVLSGYYPVWNTRAGYIPQKLNFSTTRGNFEPNGPGRGGDFLSLAADLNKYTYDLLTAEYGDGPNRISDAGPWGLVMMDHIKANDVSADLVELIMMNNFKFPLVTVNAPDPDQKPEETTYNATYSNGGEAISFK